MLENSELLSLKLFFALLRTPQNDVVQHWLISSMAPCLLVCKISLTFGSEGQFLKVNVNFPLYFYRKVVLNELKTREENTANVAAELKTHLVTTQPRRTQQIALPFYWGDWINKNVAVDVYGVRLWEYGVLILQKECGVECYCHGSELPTSRSPPAKVGLFGRHEVQGCCIQIVLSQLSTWILMSGVKSLAERKLQQSVNSKI